jgi:hypothetical protein
MIDAAKETPPKNIRSLADEGCKDPVVVTPQVGFFFRRICKFLLGNRGNPIT